MSTEIDMRALLEAGVSSETFFLQWKPVSLQLFDFSEPLLPVTKRGRPHKKTSPETYMVIPKMTSELFNAIVHHPNFEMKLDSEIRKLLFVKSEYYNNRNNRWTTTDFGRYRRWLRSIYKTLYRNSKNV